MPQLLTSPLTFLHGPALKNRWMLAPLTNGQSPDRGLLSDDEYHWLTLRARGGFGATMTCAAHVQARGQGFEGQLGVFSDDHLAGLTRLAAGIHEQDSVALIQLHHSGIRCPEKLIGHTPQGPSDHAETGARAFTADEVGELIESFIAAALRAQRAGFDGVELHAAHGYALAQFLSSETNQRTDRHGGPLENRSRILFEIIAGIRERCSPDLTLGVRLSPERFGMRLMEAREIAQGLMRGGEVDFLDLSLWDSFKEPNESEYRGRSLLSYFTELERGEVRLGVAGKIYGGVQARACLEAGADFVLPGRAAILHHDFPERVERDPGFVMAELPVSREYLRGEGLGAAFVEYMSRWDGLVEG